MISSGMVKSSVSLLSCLTLKRLQRFLAGSCDAPPPSALQSSSYFLLRTAWLNRVENDEST